MGTSKTYKPENNCLVCGTSVVNMSREQQDIHEEKCRKLRKEQKTL